MAFGSDESSILTRSITDEKFSTTDYRQLGLQILLHISCPLSRDWEGILPLVFQVHI